MHDWRCLIPAAIAKTHKALPPFSFYTQGIAPGFEDADLAATTRRYQL